MNGYHKSVLFDEVLGGLNVQKDKWFLDCTLGDGGYSLAILKLGGRVVGLDVDPQALERAKKRFEQEDIDKSKYQLIKTNFRDYEQTPIQLGQTDLKFAGAIFDLGVSSLQLESPERGFSFGKNGPLDMRMDPSLDIQALDLVNNLSGKELYELFKNLGEEKHSKRLADFIVSTRKINPFTTTGQLAFMVEKAIGRKSRDGHDKHPATRMFQALRIMVNDELGALEEGLKKTINLIEKNGYIFVISFHSLEDRIVKNIYRSWESEDLGDIMTPKPIIPTMTEVLVNPRSRSAKMRIFKV